MAHHSTRAAIAALAALSILAGCGGDGDSKEKAASQTAAKVNSDEITVHQINAELQRAARGNTPQNAEAASKRILEGLIDQTLLVQEAKEAKVDRDPQVLQLLEASRRQIIAQAYIDKQASASPPSQDEIKDFYAKNPDLFEKRRVYLFREFLFERSKFTDELRNQLNAAKTPADVGKALNAAGIRFRETNSTRPAEALPIEALPRIAQLNKGDTLVFSDANLASVLMLMDYAEQGVPLDRATPLITQYLVNQKKRDIAQTKVKDLRAKGKIEYIGNFAKAEGDAAKAADAKSAPAAAPAGAPAQETLSPVTDAPKDDAITKGLSGLR
jgi:EpsD family peptidyl-prolyl cis-trans isomerase